MSRLNDLLRQLRDENAALATEIEREVKALADRRAFGLNFERHVPETVELPGRKVRKGDKVRVLPPRGTTPKKSDERLWRVISIDRTGEAPTSTLEALDDAEASSAAVADLIVVAEFRDPIYPGLVSTGKVERGGDKPFHVVINAENYHALQTLLFTHRGKVDCIYIDPPYNTGNDSWIYNDNYVAADDHYKHSKWLAFIERRLTVAKELLRPTGTIVVAISDDEHHRLRMLMDQVFEPGNFLANLIWQGNVKNDARFGGGGIDYMLVYASSKDALVARDQRWLESKPDVDLVFAAALDAWRGSGEDPVQASRLLKKWWSAVPKESPVLASKHYSYVDDTRPGEPYFASPLMSPNYRKNLVYELRHPITDRAFVTPRNGWRYGSDSMRELVAKGGVHFGKDETTLPMKKVYLRDVSTQVPVPSFRADRRAGGKHLQEMLGSTDFPFPKNVDIVAKWVDIVTSHDPHAVVLDFFGGSATTAEAVMRLNAADGGDRRCILVTNNEVAAADANRLRKGGHRRGDDTWEACGVYQHVAKPRIAAVVTGVRPDESTSSTSLEQNVEFFTLTYEAPLRVTSNREFAKIAPLLWLRAGSKGRRVEDISAGWDVAETYGVIADLDHTEEFLKAVAAASDIAIAYIVTDEDRLFESVAQELPDHVEPVRLYEAYLRNFEIESGRGAL